MNNATLESLIVCTNATRGDGKDFTSPVRSVTEIYTNGGELIARHDYYTWNIEQIKELLTKMKKDNILIDTATVSGVMELYFSKNNVWTDLADQTLAKIHNK